MARNAGQRKRLLIVQKKLLSLAVITHSPFNWCEYWLRGKQFRESTEQTDPDKVAKFLRSKIFLYPVLGKRASAAGLYLFQSPTPPLSATRSVLVREERQSSKHPPRPEGAPNAFLSSERSEYLP